MQAFLWRGSLIGILVITLIGSIAVAAFEPGGPSLGAILGVIGSVGSLMGAFVTTGLDITQSKDRTTATAYVSVSVPTTPYAPYAPSSMPTRKPRSISWLAMMQAATIGAILAGIMGLLTQFPVVVIGLACCCLEYMNYALVGVSYVWFARHNLGAESAVRGGPAFLASALAAIVPAVVGSVGNGISGLLFSTEVAPEGSELGLLVGGAIGICVVILLGCVLAGVAGLIAGSLGNRQAAQGQAR